MPTMPTSLDNQDSLESSIASVLKAEELWPDDKEDQALAVSELKTAIEIYQRHLDPEVSLQRKEIKALANSFERTLEQIEKLSPQTLSLYCDLANESIGEVSIPLRKGLVATQKAAERAASTPHVVPDSSRNVLTYEVARVMRDTLGIRPAATRDNVESNVGMSGGAAYARLLRKMLFIAGDTPPNDLYPLIERGLAILENPRGDRNV